MSRRALGRGLEALIPEVPTIRPSERGEGVGEVDIDTIRPNPYQPRTVFDAASLEELAGSIRENGLIQPLIVREAGDGGYELIAGERRFLAAKQAGLARVPVVVRQASRREMLEVALVENLQREDLNPMEEAEAYQRLATEFGLTQEEIARRVGKSRTAVTNALRLRSLEDTFRDLVSSGVLSAGHARALLAVPPGESRRKLARDIVDQGLSVRQAEARVNGPGPRSTKPTAKRRSHPALEAWEGRLRDHFGTQARIVGGLAKGRVEIHYFSGEDLERILELAGVGSTL
jgi:ParB family chromosome partitioning protein